jgi:hypothetical protein
MLYNNPKILIRKKPSPEKTIFFVFVFSMANMVFLGGTFNTLAYATTEEANTISDEEASNQGYSIIGYCYDSLQNNYFVGYTLRHCDVSMVYFDKYCQERAFYPEGNVCLNDRAMNELSFYVQQRGIEDFPSPGYFYPIEFE